MPTITRPPPAVLPWKDSDAEYAESYRGGGRKEAIKENLKSMGQLAICMTPGSMVLESAKEGYHYSGVVGAIGRGIIEGIPLQIYATIKAPLMIAKDAVDVAAHVGASLIGK